VSFPPSLFALDLSTFPVLVDDGTGVLDCRHLQPLPNPLPTKETATSKDQIPEKLLLPAMPTPITRIGQFIRVEGKVYKTRESRQIAVQNIGGLSSS
jgi:hypothetical protein